MDVAGKDELDLADPLLDCLRLWLRPLVVLLEIIREVPVEVEPPGVVSALTSLAGPLAGNLNQRNNSPPSADCSLTSNPSGFMLGMMCILVLSSSHLT